MEEKSKDIRTLIIYAVIAVLVIGFVIYIVLSNKNVFDKGEEKSALNVTYKDSSSFNYEKMPGSYNFEIEFSVNNPTNKDIYYDVSFDKLINSVNSSELTYSLYKNKEEVISDTRMPLSGMDLRLLTNNVIKSNDTDSFKLLVKYSGKEIKQTLSGTVNIVSKDVEEKSFAKELKKNLKENNTEIGTKVASTEEGLVRIKNDYYFRGKVLNNYVAFASLNWRIVGINDDDSVRLILEGDNMLTSPWSEARENNYENSEVKKAVEEWYYNVIGTSYSKYVSISSFCKNYELEDYITSYKKYKTSINSDYFMNCKKDYKLPVGVLNENDVMIAGGVKDIMESYNNTWYYLYNPKIDSWLISNSYKQNNKDLNSYIGKKDGSIHQIKMDEELTIRPVISLASDVKFSGSGASNDPYRITTEIGG